MANGMGQYWEGDGYGYGQFCTFDAPAISSASCGCYCMESSFNSWKKVVELIASLGGKDGVLAYPVWRFDRY